MTWHGAGGVGAGGDNARMRGEPAPLEGHWALLKGWLTRGRWM